MANCMVFGRDARQRAFAELLQAGNRVRLLQTPAELEERDQIKEYEVFCLPAGDGYAWLHGLWDALRPGNAAAGMNFPKEYQEEAARKGIFLLDYCSDAVFLRENAELTAYGLMETVKSLPLAMTKTVCLIAGYGRCGEAISKHLLAAGAEVLVTDRKKEKCLAAEAAGCSSIRLCREQPPKDAAEILDGGQLQKEAKQPVLIINTIPAPVLPASWLSDTEGGWYLEVASAPGGLTERICREMGWHYLACPALPARFAPEAAAKLMYQTLRRRCSAWKIG